ncbi:MAG: VanZ family protein [Desulfuromonadales bacterium]|nr:VanZ family protein [Desulfuromonadales bacterium]
MKFMVLDKNNPDGGHGRYALPLALCYALLIIYGTLYPFQGWRLYNENMWQVFSLPWPRHISGADLIINILAYMPLGLCLGWGLLRRFPLWGSFFIAVGVGASLSVSLEILQGFLPSRVSSLSDVFANGGGTLIGALLAIALSGSTVYGQKLLALRREWFVSGRSANVGLSALGLWTLSQLSPLVPSFDLGNLRHGLKPLWHTIRDSLLFSFQGAAAYAFGIAGISFLACSLSTPGRKLDRIIPFYLGAILLLNVPIVGRQLSLEAVIGSIVGLGLFMIFKKNSPRSVVRFAAVAILTSFVLDGLLPGKSVGEVPIVQPLNFIPFIGQMENISGLTDILIASWPFFALGYLALQWRGDQAGPMIIIAGGLLVFSVSFGVEWAQRTIPGRSPDLTDVIIAVFAWMLPFFLCRPVALEK